MFQLIYYEENIAAHPKVKQLLSRFSTIPALPCRRYSEIFNRKNQNFRLQKRKPSLILAEKYQNHVLPTPVNYTIGGKNNYYFSHMMNCIYDCRYCFLQGMYRSANYVHFVNHDAFEKAMQETLNTHREEEVYFFSGYDCDSLALENVTGFIEGALPFFHNNPLAKLELRTKSTNIRFLQKIAPLDNVIVAYTLTPKIIADNLEHKTPPLHQRIKALQSLQKQGWKIGLRFDPIIFIDDYEKHYEQFFNEVFNNLDIEGIHSVTMGPFRVPNATFKAMARLYPEEKLFSHSIAKRGPLYTYPQAIEEKLLGFCRKQLLEQIPEKIFYHYEG